VQVVRPPVLAGEGAAQGVAQLPAAPETPSASDQFPALPQDTLPDEFMRRAREEYDAGRIASAIAILDQFRALYPAGSDEAWWLYAQCYEANSPSRDILMSLEYYRRLVQEFSQSSRSSDARRRIAFLERFYINIR
jgi:outer membrane protein assembly factor BamD (BamD/ComL family)